VRRRLDGQAAEALAAEWLASRGLRIVERNYRCRAGEIDLIAEDGAALVFVEVRLRRSAAYGGAAASVDHTKRQRLIRAAQHYLMGQADRPCRFDVILLDALDERRVEWLRDAFGA